MSVSYYSRELVFTGDVGPDAESIYSLIFTSSLYIISAVIPNYTGFKTIIAATVIGCVSRLLSRRQDFFFTGSDILPHVCCLGLARYGFTAEVPKVVSRDTWRPR